MIVAIFSVDGVADKLLQVTANTLHTTLKVAFGINSLKTEIFYTQYIGLRHTQYIYFGV